LEITVETTVHSLPTEGPVKGGLDFALAEMAKALSAMLTSKLQNVATSATRANAILRLLRDDMLPMLEEVFFRGLLAKNDELTRQQRAILMHLLSTADVRRLLPNVVDAALSAATASGEGEAVTSEEAAKLLHVSRTHINSLVDAGKLGPVSLTQGGHRRILKAAVLDYKPQGKRRQAQGLAAMAETSQRLGLYGDDLKGVRRKTKR
jgi:excisionase family DNA binding protein